MPRGSLVWGLSSLVLFAASPACSGVSPPEEAAVIPDLSPGNVSIQAKPCKADGANCTTSSQCCSLSCNANGTCGVPTPPIPPGTCLEQGAACSGTGACTAQCCSRACGPGPSGNATCQPPSGCKPTGEVCRSDSDCCGWAGAPSPVSGPSICQKAGPNDVLGRCSSGNACREAGSLCNTGIPNACSSENNCCDPIGAPSGICATDPSACCRPDTLGIGRCLLNYTSCSSPVPAGTTCATSADCCGQPCVGDRCVAACVPSGGTCTTHADCCPGGSCTIAIGAKTGTCGGSCGLYGQACTSSGSCCNGVPCTGGRCLYP